MICAVSCSDKIRKQVRSKFLLFMPISLSNKTILTMKALPNYRDVLQGFRDDTHEVGANGLVRDEIYCRWLLQFKYNLKFIEGNISME